MIKLLMKTLAVVVVATATIGGTLVVIDVQSSWRYNVASTVTPGSSITLGRAGNESLHLEIPVTLSATRTIDIGGPATLAGAFLVAMITGYVLRGRRTPTRLF